MTTQTQAPEPVDQDQAKSPEMTEPTTVKVRRPGFRKEPETSPIDPSPEVGLDDSSEAGGDFPEPSEQMPDEPSSRSGSSRTSSRADKRALQKAVGVGFAGATTGAHEFLVRDPYAKAAGLFLADEQDVAAVSEPGGNMLARRMGDVPLGGDLGDVIDLIVAGAGYLLKQFAKMRWARELRDGGLQLDGTHDQGDDEPAPPAPYDIPLA